MLLGSYIRLALGKTGKQMSQALVPVYLCSRAGFSALWLASLSRPQFLLEGPGFSGLLWQCTQSCLPHSSLLGA